ncbi:MAG: DUF1800 family protein [Hyphomicrobiaceae bacterium]|nr:DUF1800 family protein [Hyphomicrobiaceae bacterium]
MTVNGGLLALRRFGLGARPGEVEKVAQDPRGFLLGQLSQSAQARLDDPDLEPSHVTFAAAATAQQQRKLAKDLMRESALSTAQQQVPGGDNTEQRAAARAMKGLSADEQSANIKRAQKKEGARPARIRTEVFVDEATVRFRHQAATNVPFVERLVMFWSNHFCIMARGPVRGIAGAYEREVIRAKSFGSFTDLLKAVEQHPAMLIYLDNQISFGPNSPAGLNQKKGLNENLAREILELHTLGVDGGYSQADVTNLARIVTGWTVAALRTPNVEAGKFFYHKPRHEPGDWAVLGKNYKNEDAVTGVKCLEDLARHPATARHIARKFARHFVADQVPDALTQRLEKAFRDTEGDLTALAKTLVTSDEAWAVPASKLLPPIDLVVALTRSLAHQTTAPEMLRLANQLGQPLWQPPSPKGWPDDDNGWANPSALRERLRIAEQVARLLDKSVDPRQLAEAVLGRDMRKETRDAVARAENREQGLELLIMSPDFQRR